MSNLFATGSSVKDQELKCCAQITYSVSFAGTASEEDRSRLADLGGDGMHCAPTPTRTPMLMQHSSAHFHRSAHSAFKYGLLTPRSCALTIGHTTVERTVEDGGKCAGVLPKPTPLEEGHVSARKLMDALDHDAEMRRDAEFLHRPLVGHKTKRAVNVVSRASYKFARWLLRKLACWNTPRLPVLNRSVSLFLLLITVESAWCLHIAFSLLMVNAPPCALFSPNASHGIDANGTTFSTLLRYMREATPSVADCALFWDYVRRDALTFTSRACLRMPGFFRPCALAPARGCPTGWLSDFSSANSGDAPPACPGGAYGPRSQQNDVIYRLPHPTPPQVEAAVRISKVSLFILFGPCPGGDCRFRSYQNVLIYRMPKWRLLTSESPKCRALGVTKVSLFVVCPAQAVFTGPRVTEVLPFIAPPPAMPRM